MCVCVCECVYGVCVCVYCTCEVWKAIAETCVPSISSVSVCA